MFKLRNDSNNIRTRIPSIEGSQFSVAFGDLVPKRQLLLRSFLFSQQLLRYLYTPYCACVANCMAYITLGRIDCGKLYFPWLILDHITGGNNVLCVYECMLNSTNSEVANKRILSFILSQLSCASHRNIITV